ncbi:MAG: hypothetical protein H6861_09055 [Rhodospirillales bacterium]|nr:hypothetical protein [Rhodospirillales bacterium]
MRLELEKFLQKLGVSHTLSPYETQPWLVYSEEKTLTCSAEVRMGPDGHDIEAEIQFLHDEKDDDDDDEDGAESAGGREQILWMRAEPTGENQWGPKYLRIKDKDYTNDFHGWEEKGCEVFLSCVEALQMNEIPDIDMLIEDKMKDDSWGGGGRRGKIGRKSPKVKPAALMGMKKP